MAAIPLTRTHRILIGIVVAGAVIIAAIGFAGSYAAVRELAEAKGFGQFSLVFPIGIDAGICVLLALDLLLTWMRIPFPLLRQTAWLLTAATIAFNGAASWPDPLGTAMHAVIPVLFVVSVEAARHAVGRIADITADKHMEGVRLTRWLLSPVPTFKLWRRMKLWELRSYEQVIKLEQERLIYQARLQARFGRNWRRKAPVESMMPLRLAKYGVPLAETAPAGLAAAGIEPALLPPAPKAELPERPELSYDPQQDQEQEQQGQIQGQGQGQGQIQPQPQAQSQAQQHQQHQQPMSLQKQAPQQQQHHPVEQAAQAPAASQPQTAPQAPVTPETPQVPVTPETPQVPPTHDSPWFAAQKLPEGPHSSAYDPEYTEGLEPTPAAVPLGPGRTRPLGDVGTIGAVPHPRQEERPQVHAQAPEAARVPEPGPEEAPQLEEWPQEDAEYADLAFEVFSAYTDQEGQYPSVEILDIHLADTRNVRHPRSTELLQRLMPEFRKAYVPAQATADQSA
ncbi:MULTISPECIES: DUF2637 domain-containing protein [Streptomyces]|uniref:DUF2637 domain-containing protein n=2 Tax=Streptomyces TaxID=1883 RepID=A0A1E7LL26_9ACTN|nr:DUF2637 domain-containing protein [Streptomyces nanshensis]OEV16874.1 hypothetical protein AN221_29735 [Streptomyces nanshensis]